MSHQHFYQDHNQKPAGAARPAEAGELNHNKTDFPPYHAEVAARAYLSYVNQGSPPGREVEHWLEAEAQLIAERNQTRAHGYHNPT
jgi:hypothetical protein